ncbi:hypothetical protein HYW21_06900 [Candidatus Woesearchaeota archaeon]|nr:hypothetical protein [Candidatus Woesearchaeota archaeon]
MVQPTILTEVALTMGEVKQQVQAIKKRDKDLNLRTQKTEDYLKLFAHLDQKKEEELKKKLVELNIPRLRDSHIVKIVDILPETVDDLKVILSAYPLTINNDNMKKIVSVVKEVVPGKG